MGSDVTGRFGMAHAAVTGVLNSACSGGSELSWGRYSVMVTIIITCADTHPSASKCSAAKAQQAGVDHSSCTAGFQAVRMVQTGQNLASHVLSGGGQIEEDAEVSL